MDQNNSSRFVRAVHTCEWNNTKLILPCGCALVECKVCGVKHSAMKCALHQPEKHDSQTYYLHELRGTINGLPQHTKICAELEAALIRMGVGIACPVCGIVLDIGAGIGYNAPFFLTRGFKYEAIECDRWAGKYIWGAYMSPVHAVRFEDFNVTAQYDVVIASHVLEHLTNPNTALDKIHSLVKPGGRAIVIVPNDDDLCNPDHVTFFNEHILARFFREAGFDDVRVDVAQIVPWEKFIYMTGVKSA